MNDITPLQLYYLNTISSNIQSQINNINNIFQSYKTSLENNLLFQPIGNYALTSALPNMLFYKTSLENGLLYQPIGIVISL